MRLRVKPRLLLLVWAVLLVASHAVRHRQTDPPPRPSDRLETALPVQSADGPAGGEILLRYGEWPPPAAPGGSVILLLHGSPGSARDFAMLAPLLAERGFPVLAPDLPGFGASSRRLPDVSIRAHSRYLLALLDRLGIEQAHLVGFSMGGGVAIETVGLAPRRVLSLTLLSAIGVQEMELLGSYRLNHALHGLQLAALWTLQELTPHFGLLDGALLDVAYARNFFDSDQRPLRSLLAELEAPTLIVHGAGDFLVPVAAAHEHHRIVPQSELVLLDGGHFLVLRRADELAGPVAAFLRRVEKGTAPTREAAPGNRLAQAAESFDPASVPRAAGIALAPVVLLLAAATLVSEDLTSIGAGLLVAQGRVGFLAASAGCFLGIFLGDLALFWAGRALGRPALRRAPLAWLVSPERVEASSAWFREKGPAVIFLSRFLPGTRLPTYFAAGLLETPFRRFVAYFAAAVALWTPLLVGAAALAGRQLFAYFEVFRRWALPGSLALALVLWLMARLAPRLATWAGRRRLVGAWRRWRHWEFWPLWLFYLPVVGRILWLGIEHRAPTLFTAANPGIPAAGFVGESKADILGRLPPDSVARYARLAGAAAERRAAALAFVDGAGGGLPVVVKPDVGERGAGVVVARTRRELERAVQSATRPLLIQEYVDGPELGVFYARRPGAARGEIFSITEKVLPEVIGDGRSSVEQLVLADERAVALADVYLGRWPGGEARRVPADGERVRLTDLGTHCRGAIFLDGGRFAGPPLAAAIEHISRSFDGFFFGRYDLRAPDEASLLAGRGLKVLELNGVTSEATHIYDRRHSLARAYRILFAQWRLAFEIGAANRARGARPSGWRELWRLWREARRRAARESSAAGGP